MLKPCIKKGYKNIILSNYVPELEEVVNGLGISDYFIKVYSSAILGYEKPNGNIYEKVIKELEEVEDITMIGDSYVADSL